MFQEGLFSYLKLQAPLTALLGTSRGDGESGIFLMLAIPEATVPYIVYQRVSGIPVFSYQGANKFQKARFRFSCSGASQQSAVRVAEQLKLIFATWTGTFPDGTVVGNVMLEFEADDVERLPHGTLFTTHVDFSFMYLDNNGA